MAVIRAQNTSSLPISHGLLRYLDGKLHKQSTGLLSTPGDSDIEDWERRHEANYGVG